MQVSVETTEGLERKLVVNVPAEKIETEVQNRLQNLVAKVRIDGFRPGKVPFKIVQQRYGNDVRQEVARDMVQSTLYEALQEQKLTPAGTPYIEPGDINQGQDFSYTATFEVFPEVKFKELDGVEVEQLAAEVDEKDIEQMITRLQEQNKEYMETAKASKDGDKLVIDFEGFIDGEAFEGGKAKDFELTLGSNTMIPGFESQLADVKVGEEKEIEVTFPEDYGHKDLAGKVATFKIKVNKVQEGVLPELNEEFVKKFNIESGKLEELKADITKNMTRELARQVKQLNKERAFDAFINHNELTLPNALVDREIDQMKKDMVKRIFGNQQKVDESQIPELPRDMFESQAKRRVHLGLLVSEYVQQHELKADQEKVDAMLEELAAAYQKPDEFKSWYRENKQQMTELEAVVVEDLVVEKLLSNANVKDKTLSYDEAMNAGNNQTPK